ncbi:acid protease [Ceratobasidium sp. AG-I]|nr:acid protease [Ceratobasidium sp. AG-I]
MASEYYPRFSGGHLGLFVPQFNQTLRSQSVILSLYEQGQLLNPVWGLRTAGGNGSLTIGALDPNDYEGEINWVPALDDQPMIHVDAFKGDKGNTLPLDYPVNAALDTRSRNIYLLDLDMYMTNRSYLGEEIHRINVYPPGRYKFGVPCSKDQVPTVPFSVGINGVDYPVNQADLVRPNDLFVAEGYCNVGVWETSFDVHILGMTFLRSVYLAYRFPTGSCPGYWGFATPKGGATPTQKPKATPSDAAKCLTFVAPTSTPSPSIAASSGLDNGAIAGTSTKKFRVYGRPVDETVVLRGVNDLPPLKAAGGIGFGG